MHALGAYIYKPFKEFFFMGMQKSGSLFFILFSIFHKMFHKIDD